MARPSLTVIAGPNGSGKSSMLDTLSVLGVALPNYQNADDIVRTMDTTSDPAVRAAQQEVRLAREAAIDQKQSLCYETVMSHRSHVDAMRRARAADLFVRLIFVTTDDPSINVARVADRVAKGGHDVPTEKVLNRYRRTMTESLLPAIVAADEAILFDNSHNGQSQATLVAHIVGFFVRPYPCQGLAWPERDLFAPLRTDDRFLFAPQD